MKTEFDCQRIDCSIWLQGLRCLEILINPLSLKPCFSLCGCVYVVCVQSRMNPESDYGVNIHRLKVIKLLTALFLNTSNLTLAEPSQWHPIYIITWKWV